MPLILNFNKTCKDLKEVTSVKLMSKDKFHPKGLFSEQIFGPVKNYTCQCGIFHGKPNEGNVCKTCDVEILSSEERRRNFAKITLPIPVINPLMLDIIYSLGGAKIKEALNKLLKNEKSVLIKKDEELIVTEMPEIITKDMVIFERIDAIKKFVEEISRIKDTPSNEKDGWEVIRENLESLIIQNILVIPPEIRPITNISRNSQILDNINRYYMQILVKKSTMENTVLELKKDKALFYTYFRQLQNVVTELYTNIIEKISKKEGLIRGNILGKRIDYSGRAIISPEPTLELDECVVPYFIFIEIYKIQIAKKLIEIGKFKLLNNAVDFVEECLSKKIYSLYNICKDISKGEVCILNRQPSLHSLGLLGFKVKVGLESVIKIHPLVCAPFNADFDGDQMAIYFPISDKAKKEILEKILITKNLRSPANGQLAVMPSQDIVMGLYLISKNMVTKLNIVHGCKGRITTYGKKLINDCFPSDFRFINEVLNKKTIIRVLDEAASIYNNDILVSILDNLKKLGFKYATLFGPTISVPGMYIEKAETIKNKIYSYENVYTQILKSTNEKYLDTLKNSFKYKYMIESGSRGSWDQVRQLSLTRGFVSNFEGDIIPEPIKNSLIDGLTRKGMFNSTYGARKGLLDVALNTGESGYLSRKLIFTCANLKINKELDDCGTKDFLDIYIKDENMAKTFMYRYYLNENNELEEININNLDKLIGKTIKVRSPIFCERAEVCKKCYGNLTNNFNTPFIGILAAQSLGERATQLILRTFHLSGSASITDTTDIEDSKKIDKEKLKQMDIVTDLSSISNYFHNFENRTYKDIIVGLYEGYKNTGFIHTVHIECVISQLMWHGNRKWRLLKDREKYPVEYYSVQTVPSKESWIMGVSFSSPKRHIIKGILEKGKYRGIFDKIFIGEEFV